MGTTEERMRILKLLEEKKITADEAAKLLRAISAGKSGGRVPPGREARWLRVRVTDMDTGESKVSVNVPMGLVRTGIRMGARFVPTESEIDYQELMDIVQGGATGKIFDYTDDEQGERVEIWAE